MNWLCLHPHKPSIYISICFTFMFIYHIYYLDFYFYQGFREMKQKFTNVANEKTLEWYKKYYNVYKYDSFMLAGWCPQITKKKKKKYRM